MYKLTEAKFRDNKEVFRNPNIGTMINVANMVTKVNTFSGGVAALADKVNDYTEGRVVEYWSENTPNRAYYYTASNTTFTLCTSELSGTGSPDLTFTPAVGNALYIGEATANCSYKKPSCLRMRIGTLGVWEGTGVWEYWNGSAWTTLTCTDRTNGFRVGHTSNKLEFVEYKAPSDWASNDAYDGYVRFWLRYRITAVTSVTTAPVIVQTHFVFASQGTATVGSAGSALSLPLTVTAGPTIAASSRILRDTRPSTLCFSYLYWNEIEDARGTLNFYTPLNNSYCALLYAKIFTDMRYVYRLTMDYPTGSAHDDLPTWLKGASYLNNDYTAYNVAYGQGTYPNYDNAILISEHGRLMTLLASYILADERTYGIQIGSIGHWGELHHHSTIAYFPAESVTNQYFQHYIDNFKDRIHITSRRPFEINRTGEISAHNDAFGIIDQFYKPTALGSIPQWEDGYTDYWSHTIAIDPAIPYYEYGPVMGELASVPDNGQDNGYGWAATVHSYTAGNTTYANKTTEAASATANDVAAPPVSAQNDAIYFGYDKPFPALYITIGTAGNYTGTLVWEYYNGSSWATLTPTYDGTSNSGKIFGYTGSKWVAFYEPTDWAVTSVNSVAGYYVRCRCSAFTSVTTAPLITKAVISGYAAIDNLSQTLYPNLFKMMKDYKSSVMGAGGDCGAAMVNGVNNSNQMISRIGYRIFTNRAKLLSSTETITNGSDVQLSLGIRNRGFAKFYDPWVVELTLIDSEDAVAQTFTASFTADAIETGENYFTENLTIGVPAGTYSMAIAIIDPITRLPGVRFAQTARNDNRHVFLTGIVVS